MKRLTHILALAFVFSGCQSTPNAPTPDTVVLIEAATDLFAKQVITLALENNPKYEPVATAVLAGLDGVFFADGGVTTQTAHAFAESIALKYPMSDRSKAALASVLVDLYDFYKRTYKPTVAARMDPNALSVLQAFRTALSTALSRLTHGNPQ